MNINKYNGLTFLRLVKPLEIFQHPITSSALLDKMKAFSKVVIYFKHIPKMIEILSNSELTKWTSLIYLCNVIVIGKNQNYITPYIFEFVEEFSLKEVVRIMSNIGTVP